MLQCWKNWSKDSKVIQNNKMGVVICKLPKAGLGNQLFPLMKARVFAHLNDLPLIVTNYHQVKIGPWLRNDRSKRRYSGFFNFQKSIFGELLDKWKISKLDPGLQKIEPDVQKIESDEPGSSYLFWDMPHYTNYFKGLNENRDLVKQLLLEMISPSIKQKLNNLQSPAIGVHIRRGDFREPEKGEELGKRGILRTPETYFVDMIQSIRKVHGSDLRVNVFSDASKGELKEIFALPNISMIEENNDLEDLLLLSQSKIIVGSASSTFSYWAGFLSEAPIIMHPTYVGIKIRPANVREQLFEGALDEKNKILVNKIKSILPV